MQSRFQRVPWPPNFPDVIVHGDVRVRNGHASYSQAKSGDKSAALTLAGDMLTQEGFAAIQTLIRDRKPFLLPVSAIEVSGFNAIPDAIAQIVAQQLRLPALSGVILQANKVAHTKADGWHRLRV
jgi:hypothetical protein